MQITVIPSHEGGMYARVTTLVMPEHEPSRDATEVMAEHIDISPYVGTERDVRLWVNRVARLVARALEDELFASVQASISQTDGRTP
jgi:hypothetical protein